MSIIKDSGKSRIFESGAQRDSSEDKGRMDLVPLDIAAKIIKIAPEIYFNKEDAISKIIQYIYDYQCYGINIEKAVVLFASLAYKDMQTALIEVSKQYKAGADKYGTNNWRKGMPLHIYIDSGLRHLLKWSKGDTDEPHDRAFMWNMMSLMWTAENKPELNDLPWNEEWVKKINENNKNFYKFENVSN